MNKHLQQKQIYDSFLDEDYDQLIGDEPIYDPEAMDDKKIYDMIIEDEEIEDFNKLDLEDDEIMYL